MIHISQEELFKSIEAHPRPGDGDDHAHDAHDAHDAHATHRRAATKELYVGQELAAATALPATPDGQQLAQLPAGRRPQEMISILPTSFRKLRDRNNNTSATDATGASDDDEVHAVLITGCGSKIGSNIAVAFAARGLKVALVDFNIKQTEAVASECQEKSPKNREIVADISQLAEAHKVIDRTIEAFGRLDVLVNTVNNASLMEAKFNASGDDDPHVFEQYHKIIANNMHAVTYLCISAAPYLRKTKGSIVNVSSITNNETGSYKFAYCMSKAGISTLTKCLATDLAPDIRVICVSPKTDE